MPDLYLWLDKVVSYNLNTTKDLSVLEWGTNTSADSAKYTQNVNYTMEQDLSETELEVLNYPYFSLWY
jgi:hypothetical protein